MEKRNALIKNTYTQIELFQLDSAKQVHENEIDNFWEKTKCVIETTNEI